MKLSNKEKNIAIFGATGHIAKNLIYYFSKNTEHKLFLFSRNKIKLQNFVSSITADKNIVYDYYENIPSQSFDIIINCIGISNPSDVSKYDYDILTLTERYDEIIIEYLKKNDSCLFLNFSSGVVYGDFSQPANDEFLPDLFLDDFSRDAYSLAKINSENKHRALPFLNIIDIRIFSFFSRFIDLNTSFFISELITFFRDFIHPYDLYHLISLCIKHSESNFVLDAYSTSPISKYDILEEFSNHYDLKYSFKSDLKIEHPTGFKEKYYSLSKKAKNIDYNPIYSSLETILGESHFLIFIL
ncbi:MAG: hypothetical protein CXT78_03105 [Thaumarchaeota archaeon]|nr:MAG: hypothetical protein CXT78_03105 [Nitrososphaerota archaeon]